MRATPRFTLAAALAAAALALPAAPAAAQGVTGVSLTPGVIEVELPTRQVDLPFTIANNEAVPVHLDLSVQQLTQSLDGSFGYGEASPLTVSPTDALLQPGEHAKVRVTGAVPAGAPALYAGLLATPRGASVSGNVEIRTRVAGLILLTLPGEHAKSVAVEDVTLTPTAEDRTYRVGAVLRSTGQVHVRPKGIVHISQLGGAPLGSATLTGMVLLPGFARRLDGGVWTAPPPPLDTVRMDVVMSEPPATGGGVVNLPAPGATGSPEAPAVTPGTGLGELGDGDGDGAGSSWLMLLAGVLLLAVSALMRHEHRRRVRPAGAQR